MTVITIDTKNKTELAKAKAIAKENGWIVNEPAKKTLPKNNGKKLAALLTEFASKGGPVSFPADVSSWQRTVRKDKKLTGR